MFTLITDNLLKDKITVSDYENRLNIFMKNGLLRIIIRDDKNIKNQMDTLLGIHTFAYVNNISIYINCSINDYWYFKDIKGVTGIHLSGHNVQEAVVSGFTNYMNWGTSIHDLDELQKVINHKPSYALVSPIFETVCKPGVARIGIKKGHALCDDLLKHEIQPVALGGINSSSILQNPSEVEFFKEAAIRSLFYESDNLERELKIIKSVLNKF